jgi:hypothetical protein
MASEYDELMEELLAGLYKVGYVGTSYLQRPKKQIEQRVLWAAGVRDDCESMRGVGRQQATQNAANALINDRETLENLCEALGTDTVYDIMLLNLLYEPARSHALSSVKACLAPHL